MNIDRDTPTLLISTIGRFNKKRRSIYVTSNILNVEKLLVIVDHDQKKLPDYDELITEIRTHFANLDIPIYIESTSIFGVEKEYLFFAKCVAALLPGIDQIAIDCNEGPRYIRSVIQDGVVLIQTLLKTLHQTNLHSFDVLRHMDAKKTIFYSNLIETIHPHSYRILPIIEKGVSESDMAELENIRQSTVSNHLKRLRKLGLIEGKSKSSRSRTIKGDLVLEIVNILKKLDIKNL
ncbi:MAG: helix-turn-helix domain-containing protein [Candidatus Heimdallarchaeota archaeon]|nr:helix-turn-helix domain-containing protein [Candidatus Heimdallarchaeota archaeon]